jgi:hypothetical protein
VFTFIISGIRIAQSLALCFFFWPLHCVSFSFSQTTLILHLINIHGLICQPLIQNCVTNTPRHSWYSSSHTLKCIGSIRYVLNIINRPLPWRPSCLFFNWVIWDEVPTMVEIAIFWYLIFFLHPCTRSRFYLYNMSFLVLWYSWPEKGAFNWK